MALFWHTFGFIFLQMELEITTYYTERSFLRVLLYEVEEIRGFAHLEVFTIIIFHTKVFLNGSI